MAIHPKHKISSILNFLNLFRGTLCFRRRLLRSLMNVRSSRPLRKDFLAMQNEHLSEEREEKVGVEAAELLVTAVYPRIAIWRGDITRLKADTIVNAANSAMMGCFAPLHNCIDNIIHSAAGVRLRQTCHDMMLTDFPSGDWKEPAGRARATPGFNLPCRYVFHTVGPIVSGPLREEHRVLLTSCYTSCLELAREKHCRSLAFCCISTGEFRFPREEAAHIALAAVTDWMNANPQYEIRVVFDVFTEQDNDIYTQLLSGCSA